MKGFQVLAVAGLIIVLAAILVVVIVVRGGDPAEPVEPEAESAPAELATDWQWQTDLYEQCDADPGSCLVWNWVSPGHQDSFCQSAEYRSGNFCGDLGGHQRWQLLEASPEYQTILAEEQAAFEAGQAAGHQSDNAEAVNEWRVLQAVLHALPGELVREHRIALTFAGGDIIIRFGPQPAGQSG